jgi:catechol 2,3-dioxygenase-like lactoylglutathione lyase family enzyme
MVGFVATVDLDAAEAFYGGVLGLELFERNSAACVFDAGGAQLRVTKVARVVVAPYTVLGWEVLDVVEIARALAAAGVPAERYDGMAQDDDGVWTSPSGDRVLWFKDPDGNGLSVTQAAR